MKASAQLDFLTFTVMHEPDPEKVISDILGLDTSLFVDTRGVNGYNSGKKFDNIKVFYNAELDDREPKKEGVQFMGVYVVMSSKGLDQYLSYGHDLFVFVKSLVDLADEKPNSIHFTRADFAADDFDGKLDMNQMEKALFQDGAFRSYLRNLQRIGGMCNGVETGRTLYIGSQHSNRMVRIYDKAKEQYNPDTQADLFNRHWLRVEVQFRREAADLALRHWMDVQDIGQATADVLSSTFEFIDRDDSNVSRCSVSPWWLAFLESVQHVKLSKPRESVHEVSRKLQWMVRSIAPVMSTLAKAIGSIELLGIIHGSEERASTKHLAMLNAWKQLPKKPCLANLFDEATAKAFEAAKRRIHDWDMFPAQFFAESPKPPDTNQGGANYKPVQADFFRRCAV
jgi:DNA relaxase NicK